MTLLKYIQEVLQKPPSTSSHSELPNPKTTFFQHQHTAPTITMSAGNTTVLITGANRG